MDLASLNIEIKSGSAEKGRRELQGLREEAARTEAQTNKLAEAQKRSNITTEGAVRRFRQLSGLLGALGISALVTGFMKAAGITDKLGRSTDKFGDALTKVATKFDETYRISKTLAGVLELLADNMQSVVTVTGLATAAFVSFYAGISAPVIAIGAAVAGILAFREEIARLLPFLRPAVDLLDKLGSVLGSFLPKGELGKSRSVIAQEAQNMSALSKLSKQAARDLTDVRAELDAFKSGGVDELTGQRDYNQAVNRVQDAGGSVKGGQGKAAGQAIQETIAARRELEQLIKTSEFGNKVNQEAEANQRLYDAMRDGSIAYDDMLVNLEAENELRAAGIDLKSAEAQALKQQILLNRENTQSMQRMRDIAKSVGDTISGSFEEAIFSGNSLRDTVRGLAQDLARMIFRETAGRAISGLIGNAIGGFMGRGPTVAAANGMAFNNGAPIQAFANGGIVSSPTMFPMHGGTGLMGEAGPEAIMPLKRGADGKLGVSMQGGGDTYNIDARGADAGAVERIERSIRTLNSSIEQRSIAAVTSRRKRVPDLFNVRA